MGMLLNNTQFNNEGSRHEGAWFHRTEEYWGQPNREKALSDLWKAENKPNPVVDFGTGILQGLFTKIDCMFPHYNLIMKVTNRDRYIAATVIQWLGSNVGLAFLDRALRRAGFKVVRVGVGEVRDYLL